MICLSACSHLLEQSQLLTRVYPPSRKRGLPRSHAFAGHFHYYYYRGTDSGQPAAPLRWLKLIDAFNLRRETCRA
jgi:hypothetical protein